MYKVIFALMLVISINVNANIGAIGIDNLSIQETTVEDNEAEIIVLSHEEEQQILSEVNKVFIETEYKKFEDKKNSYLLFSELYFEMTKNLIICHSESKYGDSKCFYDKFVGKVDNNTLDKITSTYKLSINEDDSLSNRIKVDLYLANYYYMVSLVFSDCNITDVVKRNECLNKIDFLVEKVTWNGKKLV